MNEEFYQTEFNLHTPEKYQKFCAPDTTVGATTIYADKEILVK